MAYRSWYQSTHFYRSVYYICLTFYIIIQLKSCSALITNVLYLISTYSIASIMELPKCSTTSPDKSVSLNFNMVIEYQMVYRKSIINVITKINYHFSVAINSNIFVPNVIPSIYNFVWQSTNFLFIPTF